MGAVQFMGSTPLDSPKGLQNVAAVTRHKGHATSTTDAFQKERLLWPQFSGGAFHLHTQQAAVTQLAQHIRDTP
jgi:hypothetical protein